MCDGWADCCGFNEWLEEDRLSEAFLEARTRGEDPGKVLSMVLKQEGDLGPEPVIYIGPKALEFLAGTRGMDIGISTGVANYPRP